MNIQKNKLLLQKISLVYSDTLALFLSLLGALLLTHNGYHETVIVKLFTLGLAKFIGILLLGVFWYQEQYIKRRPSWEEIRLIYRSVLVFAGFHLVVSYLAAHHVVKLLNIYFWLLVLIVLPLLRYITKAILNKLSLWQRDIYIVGTSEVALATYDLLQHDMRLGYNIIAFVDLDDSGIKDKNGVPVVNYATIEANPKSATEIVFAMPSSQLLQHLNKIDLLQSKYLFVSIVPDIGGLPLHGAEVEHFFGSEQLFLRLQNNLGRKLNRYMKRSMDIIVATIMLICLSPLLLVIAVLIKLTSSGTILYKHPRLGAYANMFNCYKFRTMYSDSKSKLEEILAKDMNAQNEWNLNQKLKNDPRVTKLGKFLRKTSLDELPQLLNVILGEMSLVGPRPIVDNEITKYGDKFYYYKLVRPGITGLWQISGRSDIDYKRRVQLDVWYVKNWSLWYDWVIMFRTIPALLTRNGAY